MIRRPPDRALLAVLRTVAAGLLVSGILVLSQQPVLA